MKIRGTKERQAGLKRTRQFLAGLIAIVFLVTSIPAPVPSGYATPAPTPVAGWGQTARTDFCDFGKTFTIPAEWGQVTDFVAGTQKSVLVHIKTAQADYPSQENVQSILHFLNKKYGIELFLAEGASERSNPELFRSVPKAVNTPAPTNKAIARMGGSRDAEVFWIDAHSRRYGWRWGEPEAYTKAPEVFEKASKKRELIDNFLNGLYREWRDQADLIMNWELFEFLSRYIDYEEKRLPLRDWLDALNAFARKHLKLAESDETYRIALDPDGKDGGEPLDLRDRRAQGKWPVLGRYFRLRMIDAILDKERLQSEKEEFFQMIKKNLGLRAEGQKVRDVRPVAHGVNAEAIIIQDIEGIFDASKKGDLPFHATRAIFERLKERLPEDLSFKPYPNLCWCIQQLILMSELRVSRFQNELLELTRGIIGTLAQNKMEAQHIRLLREYQLLAKLFRLDLKKREFQEIREKGITPLCLLEKLEQGEGINGYPELLGGRGASIREEIMEIYREIVAFYEVVIDRENRMIQNAIGRLSERKESKAVLITNGFHTNGFKRFALTSGSSYIQITPASGGKVMITPQKDSYQVSSGLLQKNTACPIWNESICPRCSKTRKLGRELKR